MPVQVQLIQQAFKFALAPTPRQERMFASHAGGARFAFNWGLNQISDALDARQAEKQALAEAGSDAKPATNIPGHFDLCKLWTEHKNNHPEELHWVPENFSGTYQAALRDAAAAWKAFFDSRSGKRAGRKVGRPHFKSKHRSRPAFQVHGGVQVVDTRHIQMPKIGVVRSAEKTRKLLRKLRKAEVPCTGCGGAGEALTKPTAKNPTPKMAGCKPCKGSGQVPHTRIVRGNVTRDARGRWHIALTVETHREIRTGPSQRQREGGTIGADIGVRDIAVLSDGTVIANPRHLNAALAKLARAQQALARCQDGSARRGRARARVARIHGRVADLRRDALSKAASALVHGHARIVLEGWDVQQTLQHGSADLPVKVRRARNLALASAGLGEFRWMVTSRASWYGATSLVADRHQETGRTCAACGTVKDKPIPPATTQFHCLTCGYVADRRQNTASALVKWARTADAPSSGESKNGRGGNVRPQTLTRGGQSSTKRQASTPRHRDQTGAPGP